MQYLKHKSNEIFGKLRKVRVSKLRVSNAKLFSWKIDPVWVTRLVSIIVTRWAVTFRRFSVAASQLGSWRNRRYRFNELGSVDTKPDTSTHPRPGYRLNWSEAPLRCLNRNLVAAKKANNLEAASFISTVRVPRPVTRLRDLSVPRKQNKGWQTSP